MTTANDPWGRVDADGTVYVRTADGERVIGSWAAGSPEEALAFFRRKFASLETEVALIEQRIAATEIAPAQAQSTVQRLLRTVTDANCLGDLVGLRTRLEALTTAVRINPRLWKVHQHLAQHYRQNGNPERAAWHERRAVP